MFNFKKAKKFAVFSSPDRENLTESLNDFAENYEILDIKFTTNTRYSSIYGKDYTEYSALVIYKA